MILNCSFYFLTSFLLFFSVMSRAQDSTSIKKVDWIVGCWKSTNSKYDAREHWMPPAGKMMVGVNHTVSNGKTIVYEYLRIEEKDGNLVYIAIPSGQKETTFYQDEITDKKMVFVNPKHDFPQRITYYLLNDGSIHVRVEAEKDGELKGFNIFMERVDCLK